MTSPGRHGIPKTSRHIWGKGIATWWLEFVWLMDWKGLVVKWIVDEASSSALMSPILLMICSWFGLTGSKSSVICLATRCRNCSLLQSHPKWAQRKIILWQLEVFWPLHSSDCSLCVFFLWKWVKLQVWRVKRASILDFKTAVEDINVVILYK